MSDRWSRRPALAWSARLLAVLVPAVGAVAAVLLVQALLPASTVTGVRLAALVVAATVIPLGLGLLSRRLLPLAFLLDLDLLFPDELPSRFRVALRSGSTRSLADLDDTTTARVIAEMAAAIAAHDHRTRGHSERVRAYTEVIAVELGLGSDDRNKLRWAALLHDVGKLHVAHDIINKPGPLDEDEWEAVRRHPEEGHRLIAPIADWLGPFADTILHHHERWDGGGYPNALSGTDIALGARIVAVADAYEVMTSSARVYRPTVSPAEAREELARTASDHFDPAVVRAFLAVPIADLRRIAGLGGWLAGVLTTLRLVPAAPVAAPGGPLEAGTPAFGPPVGARLPEGAMPSGQSSVDQPDDADLDDAAAAQDR